MVLKDPILNSSPAHGAIFHLHSAPHTNVPTKKGRGGLDRLKSLGCNLISPWEYTSNEFYHLQVSLSYD